MVIGINCTKTTKIVFTTDYWNGIKEEFSHLSLVKMVWSIIIIGIKEYVFQLHSISYTWS